MRRRPLIDAKPSAVPGPKSIMADTLLQTKGPFPPFAAPFKNGENIFDWRFRVATQVVQRPEWLFAEYYEATFDEIRALEAAADEATRAAVENAIIKRGRITWVMPPAGPLYLFAVPPPPQQRLASSTGTGTRGRFRSLFWTRSSLSLPTPALLPSCLLCPSCSCLSRSG